MSMHSLSILAQSSFSEADFEKFFAIFAGVGLIFFLVIAAVILLIWGMIFSRAGYSWAMALLMFIPLVNFIWLLIFAFSRWPVQKELDMYKRGGYGGQQQGYPQQPNYPPPPMR